MTEQTKEIKLDKKLWLDSFKTFGKILLGVVFALFYFVSIMFFIAPKFDAKIFNFMGFVRAEEVCYVKQYENTGKMSDLYNLVLFEQEHNEYKKELYYVNVLMQDKEYDSFCLKLDVSGLHNAGSKAMYVYVGDSNAYFVNRKVRCLYALGLTCETVVLNSLKTGDITEYAFATYVELIENSALSTSAKEEKYNDLMTTLISGENVSVAELLDERIVEIENKLAEPGVSGTVAEVLLQHSLMKLCQAGYKAYGAIGETSKASALEIKFEQVALNYYNNVQN